MSLRRGRSPISSYLSSTRGPISLVLEGALLILIGIVIAVLNANNTGHIQKVSGRCHEWHLVSCDCSLP